MLALESIIFIEINYKVIMLEQCQSMTHFLDKSLSIKRLKMYENNQVWLIINKGQKFL